MRRQWNLRTPFAGVLVEHECPRCHREVELPFGALCDECLREIDRRASRVASWAAMGSTALLGLYVLLRVPPDPTARLVGAMSIAIWYILSRLVVKRAARELMQ